MSDWWYVLVIAAIAALGIFYYLRSRRMSAGRSPFDRGDVVRPDRDFAEERETSRTSQMSDEDRTWEADSLERNREAQARKTPPPGNA
jgi:hypothetical protein